MLNKPQNNPDIAPERRSKCADESRAFAEERLRRLSPEERKAHLRQFNADILELVRAGVLKK